MKRYDLLRVVCLIGLGLGFLVAVVGLNTVQAAVYEGQWTKIILDKVNASSLDLKGTVTATGPDLTPKSYNLPATITAGRLATLARGFLRTSVYGLGINAAMMAASWMWSETAKNWIKTVTGETPPHYSTLPYASCGMESGSIVRWDNLYSQTQVRVFTQNIRAASQCSGGGCLQGEYLVNNCTNLPKSCTLYYPILCLKPVPPDPVVIETPATDQDIFNDGVKPRSTAVIPDIITGLPQVIGTPSSELQKPGMPSIYWPEIVLALRDFIANLNLTQNLFDIVNQAYTDINSLTQTQINTLINNGIDIQTLINAINNTVNNVDLSTEQKNQLQIWNNLQNPTLNPPEVVPPEPVTVEIPTDCDLIPFVCDWLTWYKGWLTEEPPPVPETVIPIEPLDDFSPDASPSGSCPAPYTFSVFGRSYELSFQPWCDLAILINPFVVALGWLFAGYIVTRSR